MPPRASKPRRIDPTVLVEDVAIDAEHVIVATLHDVPLFVVSHDGTEKRTLIAKGGVSRVVADARGIFVAGKRGLCRVDKSGAVTRLAAQPWDVVVDETYVYGSLLGSYPKYADGGVYRVPRTRGPIEQLVTGRSVSAIAVAGDRLYFASEGALHVREPNGDVRMLAPANNPHAIVVLGDAVVWTEFAEHGAPRCLSGGEVRTLAAQPYTSDLLAIGDVLYWTQSSRKKTAPAIWRMRLGDAAPEPVAKLAGRAPRLAATTTLLAWVGDNNGGVYTLQPPAIGASR